MTGLSRFEAFRKASTYALYYGYKGGSKLSKVDVAIVDPAGTTDDELRLLHKSGAVVFAYQSIMEIRREDPLYGELQEGDFIHIGRQLWENKRFSTVNVDLRSPRRKKQLLEQAQHLLGVRGFDGLFLDTAGNVDDRLLSEPLSKALIREILAYLIDIKHRYPGRLLIQNNGFEHLLPRSLPLVDGVCWENPPFHNESSIRWTEAMTRTLCQMRKETGLGIFVLTEDGQYNMSARNEIQSLARDHAFLYYGATKDYI